MDQVIEHLPNEHDVLSSNPSTTNKFTKESTRYFVLCVSISIVMFSAGLCENS
jgi:hypothetical protein